MNFKFIIMEKQIRIIDFTKKEFDTIKKTLIEWNYEWLEYYVIESTDNENVDVTFILDEEVINLSKFISLIYSIGAYNGI